MIHRLARLIVVTCLSATGLAGAAIADDDEQNWTGPYAGINGGGGITTATATEYSGPADYGEYSISQGSGTVGIGGGYNYQLGKAAVLGAETDFNWISFNASRRFYSGSYVNKARWNWFGTLRARLGLAVENALVYATGGAAYVGTNYKFGDTTGTLVKSSGVSWGYTAGAGVEVDVWRNISVRGEYLYVGLPSTKISDFGGDTGDFVSSAHLARVGINYKF